MQLLVHYSQIRFMYTAFCSALNEPRKTQMFATEHILWGSKYLQ